MDPNKEHALGLEPHGHKEKSFAILLQVAFETNWTLSETCAQCTLKVTNGHWFIIIFPTKTAFF